MKKYSGNGNCKYNVSYHIVWIPKYRKNIIKNKIENRLKEILKDKINNLNLPEAVIECMPDHLHLFIRSNTTYSISYIVKCLKGYSSYMLRKEFSVLKTLRVLWAPGYFSETIGNITQETVIIYIKNQKHK